MILLYIGILLVPGVLIAAIVIRVEHAIEAKKGK